MTCINIIRGVIDFWIRARLNKSEKQHKNSACGKRVTAGHATKVSEQRKQSDEARAAERGG